jgi:hypothetical protein
MSATFLIGQRDQEPESVFAAHHLSPSQRQSLAIQVLCRTQSVSALSRVHQVSRKFLYQQADKAKEALVEAFDPARSEAEVLFWLPVTKAWLRQLVLALVLICRSSFRGVTELFGDLLDSSISVGTIHNIVCASVAQARKVNAEEDLSAIRIGAHDEIFQSRQPILVGCDAVSTYCYLLSQEEARDSTTWGVHLVELEERGLHLDYTLADFGKGLRAGQVEAWPGVPCRGDHFHILQDLTRLSTYLENRAFCAISAREGLEAKMQAAKRKAKGQKLSKKLAGARKAEAQAVAASDDIAILLEWMQQDILAVVGPDMESRQILYDWVVAELSAKDVCAPHRIKPLVRKLGNRRDDLLAFAGDLETHLSRLAQDYQVAPTLVRQLFETQGMAPQNPRRWQIETQLRQRLGSRFHGILEAITQIIAATLRASSVVENLNSRLRNYFLLRKHLGKDYLDLLRFFLNHRRFIRSERTEREGKSPTEILTAQEHPHWLNLLGFQMFKRA